jgi:hypothetical protein
VILVKWQPILQHIHGETNLVGNLLDVGHDGIGEFDGGEGVRNAVTLLKVTL